jgi:hypothetical protein
MCEPVLDLRNLNQFDIQQFKLLVASFESNNFDVSMRTILEGMMEEDWVKAMMLARDLWASSGY